MFNEKLRQAVENQKDSTRIKLKNSLPKIIKKIEKRLLHRASNGQLLSVTVGRKHISWDYAVRPDVILSRKVKSEELFELLKEYYKGSGAEVKRDENSWYWIRITYPKPVESKQITLTKRLTENRVTLLDQKLNLLITVLKLLDVLTEQQCKDLLGFPPQGRGN